MTFEGRLRPKSFAGEPCGMRRSIIDSSLKQPRLARSRAPALTVVAALLLGACANAPKIGESFALADAKKSEPADPSKPPQTEMERAIDHWGKENAKNPRDLKAAINYAKNLKAAGHKEQALGVLQGASTFHGSNRELASEYGRVALDVGQAGLAQKLLEAADDPANPDWKVISARGTAHAKQGDYASAIPLYERALLLSPNQPSVVSNLAMAHAASGDAPRAESMLRQVAEAPNSDAKVRQNLSLVLGLQGKYEEARIVSAKDMPNENAAANVEYVRQMVRAPAQGGKTPAAGAASVQQAVIKRGGPDAYTPPSNATPDGQPNPGGTWASTITTASTNTSTSTSRLFKPSQR
jgi:Flp pilus assembly protein TadD